MGCRAQVPCMARKGVTPKLTSDPATIPDANPRALNASQEAALADLDAQMAKMQESVAAAESRAAMLENTVATAKDQLLRLNADFDNFRRRSVSGQLGCC